MNEYLSPEERSWRQSLHQHEFPIGETDWQAMEALIDQTDRGAGGLPNVQGPVLDQRWPFPFFTGVLLSVIIMAMQAWSAGEPAPVQHPDHAPTIEQPNSLHLADQAGLEDVALPADEPAIQVRSEAVPGATSGRISTSKPVSRPGSPTASARPNPVSIQTNDQLSAPAANQPLATLADDENPSAKPQPSAGQRPTSTRIDDLDESQYTPGLMAFSRLTGKVAVGAKGELPGLPAQAIPLPKFQTRWSMGILAGPRLALPVWPFRTATPGWHAGLYVQADLSPHWAIRSELAVKTLDNELERETSDVLYDAFGASIKVDQTVYTNGLLFVELPVLAVRRMGRHEWFGGPRLTWVNVRDDVSSVATKGSAFTEVNYLEIRDGIRKTDLGLVLGYGYRLHQRWAVDVRYNQGLFDLTYDDFFNNTRTLLNSDLQFSLRYAF